MFGTARHLPASGGPGTGAAARAFWFLGRMGRRRAARIAPWGDGLVEQSLTAHLRPCRWDEVADDELVLLLPSLLHPAAMARVGPLAADGPASRFLRAADEWREATARPDRAPRPARAPNRVQQILDRLHAAALKGQWSAASCVAPPMPDEFPSLAPEDAAIGAVHARIHPAYADPRLALLHETLSVCCWLGHLAAGRDALLPPAIAGPLATLLDSGAPQARHGGDPAAAVVAHYADLAAGGATRLAASARAVARTGRTRLVRSCVPSIV